MKVLRPIASVGENFSAAVIACGSCAIFVTGTARAQCDYELTSYWPSELDGYGAVRALTVFDDGSGPALVAGGYDLLPVPGASSSDAYHIAKWSPSTGWVPVAEPNELYQVSELRVFNGQLYAAASSPRVSRWDGAQWVSVDEGLNGWVNELAVFDDGSGSGPALFAITGSGSPSRLLKLTNGAWEQIAQFNHYVYALHVFGGELIVAGYFTGVDDAGVNINRIAAWNGERWSALGDGMGDGGVFDLIQHEVNGFPVLFASGSFTQAGGNEAKHIAGWNGSDWFPLPDLNIATQESINTMGVWDNGAGAALLAAITTESPSSGDQFDTLFRLDAATGQWHAIGTGYYLPYSGIGCRAAYHDIASESPTLFVGGKFSRFGSVPTYNLVRVLPQPDGSIQPLPSDPKSLRGPITSFAKFDAGNGAALYAGGLFVGLGHAYSSLVARFDGDSWTSIGRALGSGRVETLKTLDDGSGPALYAGGTFSGIWPYTGQQPALLAKWNGSAWTRMGVVPGTVYGICVHDDGSGPAIYIKYSGGIARWNPASASWSVVGLSITGGGTWGPDLNAMASFDDGSGPALYVGGLFDIAGGVPARNVARWRPAEGWSQVGEGLAGSVSVFHVHDDGSGDPKLIVNQPGGVAQWDGKAWSAVGSLQSIGFYSGVDTMATFNDGSGPALIVSNGNRTARWNGSFWAHLPNQGADAFLPDNDVLYMGNPFSTWAPGGNELAIISQTGGGSFEPGAWPALKVNVVHGGAVTYQWRHNGSPLPSTDARANPLKIYNINGSHEGVYDVVVTNDCTSVVSAPIEIDVLGTCVGDISGDGIVDVSDLLALVGAWGSCAGICLADLTHDRVVDGTDLITLISRWGPCP